MAEHDVCIEQNGQKESRADSCDCLEEKGCSCNFFLFCFSLTWHLFHEGKLIHRHDNNIFSDMYIFWNVCFFTQHCISYFWSHFPFSCVVYLGLRTGIVPPKKLKSTQNKIIYQIFQLVKKFGEMNDLVQHIHQNW